MNIAEKLSTIANNVSKVYNAGYEQGLAESGGGSDVIGIILSDFTDIGLPRVADARSISPPTDAFQKVHFTHMLFANGYSAGMYNELRDVYLPNGLTYLSSNTFARCSKLENVYGDLTNLIQLSDSVFDACKGLKELPYMPNLTTYGANAFRNCTSLTEVKIYKKCNVNANTFTQCDNLLDIYVPWAEGEVANAPWGATNATIHYNTTYDENHNPIVPNGLVYELAEPMTFNGTSDYIDTGVKLYDTNKDFAILMEFENPTNDQSETLIHCMYESSPWYGVTMKVDRNLLFSVVGTSLMETFISTTGVTRLALAKVGEYYTLKVMHNGITSPQVLKEGNVGYASIPNNLLLGAYQDNDGVKGRFWSGTINSCKVYFDTLPTDDETNAFLMDGTV